MKVTKDELLQLLKKADKSSKRAKHGNIETTVDGFTFKSSKEADRYIYLKTLQSAGEISHLEVQPPFELVAFSPRLAAGFPVGRYTADFRYVRRGEVIVEDVKGESTKKGEAYRLRKRIAEACHSIVITEI